MWGEERKKTWARMIKMTLAVHPDASEASNSNLNTPARNKSCHICHTHLQTPVGNYMKAK